MSDSFESILDESISALQAGVPVEEILAEVPEYAAELRPLLYAAAVLADPNPTLVPEERKSALRAEYIKQVADLPAMTPLTFTEKIKAGLRIMQRRLTRREGVGHHRLFDQSRRWRIRRQCQVAQQRERAEAVGLHGRGKGQSELELIGRLGRCRRVHAQDVEPANRSVRTAGEQQRAHETVRPVAPIEGRNDRSRVVREQQRDLPEKACILTDLERGMDDIGARLEARCRPQRRAQA